MVQDILLEAKKEEERILPEERQIMMKRKKNLLLLVKMNQINHLSIIIAIKRVKETVRQIQQNLLNQQNQEINYQQLRMVTTMKKSYKILHKNILISNLEIL